MEAKEGFEAIAGFDDFNCSASYAMTTLSVVEDRICMATNQTTKLSS
ncbi:MAG: hypothetical protein ACPIOQ_80180 [Promethearchaeia archaeon]